MKRVLKAIGFLALAFIGLILLAGVYLYATGFGPDKLEQKDVVCPADTPTLQPGRPVKVLVWNVQYMASKNYEFFYDLPNEAGKDTRPSPEHIQWTLGEVTRVIQAENPDILLIQELHDNHVSTDHMDQHAELLKRLGSAYPCHTQAHYWKAGFVPKAQLMGSAGMKLGTFSRYKISKAERHALSPMPAFFLVQRLAFHRAVLAAYLPVAGGADFVALNIHMDAFAKGTDLMDRQVAEVGAILSDLRKRDLPWLLGGDFNLLPPGFPRSSLYSDAQTFYNEKSEIAPLFENFQSAASREALVGPDRARYYTINSNNRKITTRPDRTIDYVFYSRKLKLKDFRVRQNDTMNISDHLPLVAEVVLPGGGPE